MILRLTKEFRFEKRLIGKDIMDQKNYRRSKSSLSSFFLFFRPMIKAIPFKMPSSLFFDLLMFFLLLVKNYLERY